MVSSGKRRLSNGSDSAKSGKRAVQSRIDSGLRRHCQPGRSGATGLGVLKRPTGAPGALKRPAGALGSVKRPAGALGAVKRPAGALGSGRLVVEAEDSVSRPSKRPRVNSTCSGAPLRNGPIPDQESEECAAILRERKAARQMKWSRRVFGGRSVSAACFGANTVADVKPVSAGDQSADVKPVSAGDQHADVKPVSAGDQSAGVKPVSAGDQPAETAAAEGPGSVGGRRDQAPCSGEGPRKPRRSSGGGAASCVRGGSTVGVRLNKAAQRRMEKNRLTMSALSLQTSVRRQTMTISSRTAPAPARRLTALPARAKQDKPAVSRRPLHAPKHTVPAKAAGGRKSPSPWAGRAGAAGKAGPSHASRQCRTLSSMHRAGGGQRSLAIKAVRKPSSAAVGGQGGSTAAESKNTPSTSGRRRVRRGSYSVDDAHVAATPHIRRPSILTASAASQLPAAGDVTLAAASSAAGVRRTPVGFMPPSASIPLQLRLKKWLAKRGKSLSSYRHLQCFHSSPAPVKSAAAVANKLPASRTGSACLNRTRTIHTPTKVVPSENVCDTKPLPDDPVFSPTSCQQDREAENGGSSGDCPDPEADDKQTDTLNQAIDELRELQTLGLPGQQLEAWLLRLSEVPGALQRAGYWLCHAAAAERQGRLDQLLDSFRQASCAKAEPVSELVDGLQSLLSRATAVVASLPPVSESAADCENVPPVACPGEAAAGTPVRARRRPLLDTANIFRSSAVKYAVLKSQGHDSSTHLHLAKRVSALLNAAAAERAASDRCAPSAIITPVRRSTRRRCCVTPSVPPRSVHLTIVDSLDSISDVLRQSALFAKNSALKLTP